LKGEPALVFYTLKPLQPLDSTPLPNHYVGKSTSSILSNASILSSQTESNDETCNVSESSAFPSVPTSIIDGTFRGTDEELTLIFYTMFKDTHEMQLLRKLGLWLELAPTSTQLLFTKASKQKRLTTELVAMLKDIDKKIAEYKENSSDQAEFDIKLLMHMFIVGSKGNQDASALARFLKDYIEFSGELFKVKAKFECEMKLDYVEDEDLG
jgi:hypothetical protein